MLAAVAAAGLRSLVVTAKYRPLAEATLAYAGLAADVVAGDVWAEAKAGPLRQHGAIAYVGDHTGDIAAARAAAVTAVAAATGPIPVADLADADVLLADLRAFPGCLAGLA